MLDRTTTAALLMLIFFVAFGLRLFRLGAQPLWSDEIYSVAVARHSISELVDWVYRDNHPALYWFALYPVVHFIGDGAFVVRFPSAVMGTLGVALTYAAGRQIFGSRRVGVLAALWLTVSPMHVVYSQEARMYAPLALFGIASTLFLYRGAFKGGASNWILFGATAAATAHSHNYGLLLVAAQGLWGLSLLFWKRDRRLVWGAAMSSLAFILLYGPMVPALVVQMQMSVGSTGIATWRDLVDFLEAFGAGFTGFSTPGLTPGRLIRTTALPSVIVTMALALLGLLAGGKCGNTRDESSARMASGWNRLLLGICLVFPVVFVYVYSTLTNKALWQVRGFQMALACFALLVGAGLGFLCPRFLRWGICLGLMGLSSLNLYSHYFDRYKSTVPDAVASMESRLGSQDILFVAPYWDWTPFRYYYRRPVDAIGGWERGDGFQLAGVGTDYTDLIDPRSLEIQSEVKNPIIPPSQFKPDDYGRVWTISHWATPQRVVELFGEDVTVMHYDVETQEWRAVVYPVGTPLSRLPSPLETSSLRWDNGLRLLAYRWEKPVVVGHKARLTLFWAAERPQLRSSRLSIQFADDMGETAVEYQSSMLTLMHGVPMVALGVRSEFPTTAWPEGSIVTQDVELDIPPDLPPISYRVNLTVVDKARREAVSVGAEARGFLGRVRVTRPPEPYEPRRIAIQHRRNVLFGRQMRFLGYDLPKAPPRPGHYLPIWLHWLAEAPPAEDYEVQIRLLDSSGAPLAESVGPPSGSSFQTTMWEVGDLVQGQFGILLPPGMEGGQYKLAMRVVDSGTGEPLPSKRAWSLRSREWIVIGKAEVLPWPLVTESPVVEHEIEGRFGDRVQLLGYDLTGHPRPGEELRITLYWRARARLDESYSVFVHLTDGTGEPVAQADGIPASWLRPTTTWREGEVIVDEHTLDLPSKLPDGLYRLYVGLYEPAGQRLPVLSRGQSVPAGRLRLKSFWVEGEE